MFKENEQFPRDEDIERLAKYNRMKKIFDGKLPEVLERATKILGDSPHEEQLKKLYIAVNIIDILVTKPADLLIGEGILFESGKHDDTPEQVALNRIVRENDLNTLLHEVVIGAGIRSDAFIKTYYNTRNDVSAVEEHGLEVLDELKRYEPVIEAVPADMVFPEVSKGSHKKFKAINICDVEFVTEGYGKEAEEIPYLNVERHIPGYIIYKRFRMSDKFVDNSYEQPVVLFNIEKEVSTGRDNDIVETGVPDILVRHIPYKSLDDSWKGVGGIEKMETLLSAINDRLVQIDYILWKHSDPVAYGADIEGKDALQFGGRYIPIDKEDPIPGYMTWDGRLESAFKQLDYLLSLVYQMSETPQWIFGTTVTNDAGGTGTSHTDSRAIKLRMMPIISKVERIKLHVDRAIRDILWLAQKLELYANNGIETFESYEPQYPKVYWYNPLPKDDKEEAEIANIRTEGKATVDVLTAIKRLDRIDDMQAQEIITRIEEDVHRTEGFVDGSVFNEGEE